MPKPNDDIWIGVTAVAQALKIKYQAARDLMLIGSLGESKYQPGGRLVVKRSAVDAELKRRKDA